MGRSEFGEEQITQILAGQKRGITTAEVCWCRSASAATFPKWRTTFGEMDVASAAGGSTFQKPLFGRSFSAR